MPPSEPSVADQPVAEPTLAAVLTHVVRTTVPTRLYQLLHLALPLAVDFAFRGWWRPAAAAVAVTAFGAWGLTDRWLWNSADEPVRDWPVRAARVARAIAGTIAATLAAALLLELFLRLLGDPPGH
ncbi:MAG: hypothetical protein M3282_03605 [Gemmatimonadota bacterium]|nr:hypothetical protein [Gemmatimonadota bacterium]